MRLIRLDGGVTRARLLRAGNLQIKQQIARVRGPSFPSSFVQCVCQAAIMCLKSPVPRSEHDPSFNAPQRHRHFSTVCQAAPSVIITGGGAAGLTAAYFAALQGAEVRTSQGKSHLSTIIG